MAPARPRRQAAANGNGAAPRLPSHPGWSLPVLGRTTRKASDPETGEEVYACQATELLRAAPERIPPWDIKQYVQDVRSTNAGLLTVLRTLVVGAFNEYQDLSLKMLPRRLRIHGGKRYPFLDGALRRTPTDTSTCSRESWCGSRARRRSSRPWTRATATGA